MTVSSDQPNRNAGSGPEALEDDRRTRRRTVGSAAGQLGQGQRAEERDDAAHDPCEEDGPGLT